MKKTVSGIILLAGNSTRYNQNINKNLEKIDDKYIMSYSIDVFNENEFINDIILVVREKDLRVIRDIIANINLKKNIQIVLGGKTRGESVYNAITASSSDIVVIHDGARPLIKHEYINNCLSYMDEYKGAIIGVKAKDTIKIINELGEVITSTNRTNTYLAATPQVFDRMLLIKLYNKYHDKEFTDDASLLEMDKYKVKLVEGDYTNIKITTPDDIEIVKEYVKKYNR
ncbi:MAG: 2-C-methyl-D-erythritol 4-phosphate cytidylyltransferase [Bacilli bacterium]|nr:2-C-methyl-D-erythritol 4-phosphate cytidylyltransferase [Bacilli bacterium]